METSNSVLEEGEIEEDTELYTPLERPANYVPVPLRFPIKEESESEGEIFSASPTDSDSDAEAVRAKKPKVKLRKPVRSSVGPKKKSYNIWSTRAHEDVMGNLNSCNVTRKDMSRDCETYDYTLSYSYKNKDNNETTSKKYEKPYYETTEIKKEKPERKNNKRRHNERNDKSLRIKNKMKEEDTKGEARYLLDLNILPDCSDKDFAIEVANKLCEEKEELIEKVVNVLGRDKIETMYKEVKKIEADGGMLIMNQMRRRTPGGVFLFLVRHDNDLTKEERDIIFEEDRKKYKKFLRDSKKKKYQEMKAKIAQQKSKLPQLLTRAELLEKIADSNHEKDSDEEDVTNPPPTPETDVDAAEPVIHQIMGPRDIGSYDSDFLDLNASADMDIF